MENLIYQWVDAEVPCLKRQIQDSLMRVKMFAIYFYSSSLIFYYNSSISEHEMIIEQHLHQSRSNLDKLCKIIFAQCGVFYLSTVSGSSYLSIVLLLIIK